MRYAINMKDIRQTLEAINFLKAFQFCFKMILNGDYFKNQ